MSFQTRCEAAYLDIAAGFRQGRIANDEDLQCLLRALRLIRSGKLNLDEPLLLKSDDDQFENLGSIRQVANAFLDAYEESGDIDEKVVKTIWNLATVMIFSDNGSDDNGYGAHAGLVAIHFDVVMNDPALREPQNLTAQSRL